MMCFMRIIIAKPSTLHTHEKHINVSTMSSYMYHLCPRSIQLVHKKEGKEQDPLASACSLRCSPK